MATFTNYIPNYALVQAVKGSYEKNAARKVDEYVQLMLINITRELRRQKLTLEILNLAVVDSDATEHSTSTLVAAATYRDDLTVVLVSMEINGEVTVVYKKKCDETDLVINLRFQSKLNERAPEEILVVKVVSVDADTRFKNIAEETVLTSEQHEEITHAVNCLNGVVTNIMPGMIFKIADM